MSTTPVSSAVAAGSSASGEAHRYAGTADRRRRKRAKISAQVQVRGKDAAEPFEEICTSVDVSRDGLLFTTTKLGYRRGQQLEVVFPFSSAATALNQAQAAEIVRVTEQPGKRIAVALEFLASRTGAQQHPAVSSTSANQQSIVLAVEPDPRSAEIIRNILQQDGYTVIIAPSSSEALATLRTTVPAVFIGEVESKDMSGHDLCLIIKRNERLQHVPVILLTRSAQPADYNASHQLGAVVCMAKPFKPERLLHVVRLVAPPPTQKSAYGSRALGNSIERSI